MNPGFRVTNVECPINDLSIVAATSGGFTGAAYRAFGGVNIVETTAVMDSTLNIKIPLINQLTYDFYFKVRATAEGSR